MYTVHVLPVHCSQNTMDLYPSLWSINCFLYSVCVTVCVCVSVCLEYCLFIEPEKRY